MINIKATNVFARNYQATTRIRSNRGGSRSSKTYSICQSYIIRLLGVTGKVLTIGRKTSPALTGTVMRDFFNILQDLDLYDRKSHNKTDKTYWINGNLVEFISMDDPQKKRGASRDWLWLNEANEFTLEDWRQLVMRTREEITLDYNPSMVSHWIYTEVETREDCTLIKSTYRDNPFLPIDQVREIERLEEIDYNFWRIYGLGEIGISEATIFPTYYRVPVFPPVDDYCYGLDFGFNAPSALTKVGWKDETELFWEEMIYERGLNTRKLAERIKSVVDRKKVIFADAAEPKTIEELRNEYGVNVVAADKAVYEGIMKIKSFKLSIVTTSVNLDHELSGYSWKTVTLPDGKIVPLDEPVKFNDHLIDGGRYGTFNGMADKPIKRAKFTVTH